jgi:hypothetical protein
VISADQPSRQPKPDIENKRVQRQYSAWSIARSGKAKLPEDWRKMKETPNHEKSGGDLTKEYQPGQSE